MIGNWVGPLRGAPAVDGNGGACRAIAARRCVGRGGGAPAGAPEAGASQALKYTRRPSKVTATRCSRADSAGLIGAMCTTAAPWSYSTTNQAVNVP